MAKWKISTKYTKESYEIQTWKKGDNAVQHEICWRHGEVFIETPTDEPPSIDLENPDDLNLDQLKFDYLMGDFGESYSEDWSGADGVPDEVIQRVQSLFYGDYEGDEDEDGLDDDDGEEDEDDDLLEMEEALEADGWDNVDTVYIFKGPLELERLPD
jgi:hypothetical protein